MGLRCYFKPPPGSSRYSSALGKQGHAGGNMNSSTFYTTFEYINLH